MGNYPNNPIDRWFYRRAYKRFMLRTLVGRIRAYNGFKEAK